MPVAPHQRRRPAWPAPCLGREQSHVTDAEWRVSEPPERPAREIVNAIFCVTRSGCPWRLLPADLPPRSTVDRWFAAWRDACVFESLNYALVMMDRERVGREASPSAAISDCQSVKTTEAGGPRGYDAGKKISARECHALVDTNARALLLEPHPANLQDRNGGGPLLRASPAFYPFIARIFADSGYDLEWVATATAITIEIAQNIAD